MPTLYDAYGREVQPEVLREEQAAPTLAGIRNIYSTTNPTIALTPQKLVAIMRQAEFGDPYMYLEMAEEMEEKDFFYSSLLHTRRMAVTQQDIVIQAASEEASDERAADLVRELLLEGELNFGDALADVLDAIGKGFSVTEIIWEREAYRWYPKRLAWRDQRWFMFDWISGEQVLVRSLRTSGPELPGGMNLSMPGTRVGMTGAGAEIGIQPATEPLDPFKFITHIVKAKAGLPIRGGLARLAAWPYLFKNYVLKDWVTFAEIFGQPLRVGKYGAGATEQDKAALLRAVTNIGTDAAAIIPSSMLIEFIENKQTTASEKLYEQFCEYMDKQMSIGVLGQTLTQQLPKGGGSRAAAEVHDAVRRDIAQDDARRLCATLNRDLVKPIVDLNLGPMLHYPRIVIGFPEEEDLSLFSTAIQPFIDRGMRVNEKTILDKFGLPNPDEAQPMLHPVEKIAGTDAPKPPAAAADLGSPALAPAFTDIDDGLNRSAHAAAAARRSAPDAIDRFVEKLRDEYSDEAMAPIIRPLLAKMRTASNYEELVAMAVDAVPEMKVSKLVDLLARAGFNVNAAGQVGIPRKTIAARRKR